MKIRTFPTSLILSVMVAVAWCSESRADINCAADINGCCCRGTRGNVDCDFNDITDILDLTMLIDHLYISMAPLPSYDEANIDGQDGIDISDITALIDFLYIRLLPLPGCPGGAVNHPPVTLLLGVDSSAQLYLDAVTPTPTNHGVPFSWIAYDKIDHPYEPEPLSFQWRVYGPYSLSTLNQIYIQFLRVVFVTRDRQVLPKGLGLKLRFCDTSWIPSPPYLIVTCDSILIDTVTFANGLGALDTVFDCENAAFISNPNYQKIALQSGSGSDTTTSDTSVMLRNFFNQAPSDTTQTGYFIFWLRAIDHDYPPLADPVPAFRQRQVVDGKHEHDVLIAETSVSYEIQTPRRADVQSFWDASLTRWNSAADHRYWIISQSEGNILPLSLLLSYKIVVISSDDVIKGVLNTPDIRQRCIAASNGGTSFWVAGRALIAGDEGIRPQVYSGTPISGIAPWLGLNKFRFTGWDWYALEDPSIRIEDFIGANAVLTGWPNLTVDSALLHKRYNWGGDRFFPWRSDLAALPEVTYFEPTTDAENLYSYNSLYTDHHPILTDSFFFDGKPVVYRINRTGYRLFVSSFTPYSLAGDSIGGAAQTFVDSTLNWLYEPFQTTSNGYRSEKTTPHQIVAPSEAEEVKK